MELFYLAVLIFLSLMQSGRSGDVLFHDCGTHKNYEVIGLDIEGCDKSIYCDFKRGTTQNVTLYFSTSKEVKPSRQTITIYLKGFPIYVEFSPEDPCKGTTCPIAQTAASLSLSLNLNQSDLMPMTGNFVWELYNEKSQKVICVESYITVIE